MALHKELVQHPEWYVSRNERSRVDREDAVVNERVSDIYHVGEYGGRVRTVQYDVSTVNCHCKSNTDLGHDVYAPCGREFVVPDPMVPVKKRVDDKRIQYGNDWAQGRPDDVFVPVCMSAYGAMSRDLVSACRSIAVEIFAADENNCGHGAWDIPADHILVSLLSQRIRCNLAAAAIRSSCMSLYKLVGFA